MQIPLSFEPRPMEEPIEFTVRPLPRAASLEGAFRVHIASKDLDSLRIKPGDLCRLVTSDGSTGTGIAWRSTEQSARANTHPIKVTDSLRDAFNFKLGNTLTISKSTGQIYHADRVVITDVSDHNDQDNVKDDTNWTWRCGNILGNVEAIANGIAFEASSRKGLRKRFLIESINSSYRDGSQIFFFDDRTELVLQDEMAGPTPAPKVQPLVLSMEGIGGLNKQIQILNKRLTRLIGDMHGRKFPKSQRRNGILLYGPQGTGKSLIIKRLAEMSWRKVLRIDSTTLPGTTTARNTVIVNLFHEATAQQPSLILMDNIHLIAGSQAQDSLQENTAAILTAELEKLAGSQVLVVAAIVDPKDIRMSLRASDCLGGCELEIPIPDVHARVQILKTIHAKLDNANVQFDGLAETVGERTHGFVGRDLAALYAAAQDHAADRILEQEESDMGNGNVDGDSLATLVGGLVTSRPSVSTISTFATGTVGSEAEIEVQILQEDFEQALLQVRPTAMKEVFLEIPKVSWSQIGGSDEVKQVLTEVIEWPLRQRHHMEDVVYQPEKGVLLYGPPGCSKTMTAKAVATSSGLNFIAVKGAELLSMYVGESERAVREIFRKARAAAPSIIFFDEIDSIASDRDAHSTNGLNVLTTLLNEMDGFETQHGVIVLAATNKPEMLDSAMLRPGRFDNKVYIGMPNKSARKEILTIRTRPGTLDSSIDLDTLAGQTEGYSGAEVVSICTEATKQTIRRRIELDSQGVQASDDRRKISNDDFQVAMKKVVRRVSPASIESYKKWRDGLQD